MRVLKEPSLQEISIELNENAIKIKKRLISSRVEATNFIEICEENGWFGKVIVKNTGEQVPWRECPDDIIKSLALQLFDVYRKRIMN